MVIPQFCIGILLLLGIKTFAQFCPYPDKFYIKRGVNTYCQKIYNCKPGSEIRPCDKTCGEEKCVLCPTGTFQPFLSHSDDPIRKQCFKPDLECNPRDTIPVENGTYSHSCAMQRSCACNHSKCFYGNPCICERNFKPCGTDEEMNYKGECVKCMEGYVKPYSGCDQCERIIPTIPPSTQSPIHNTPTAKVTTKPNPDVDTTTKSTKYSSILDHSPRTTPPMVEPGNPGAKHQEETEEGEGQTLIIVFAVIGVLLVLVLIVAILLYKCKSGRRRIMKKICREREAEEPERVNGDLNHLDPMDIPEMVQTDTTNIREPLMRISMVDSGYEPHHPSLDSQISQTSHVSVSTPVQVTDGSDDFHPLMRTISHDPDASSHSALITNSSPISELDESPSLTTSTLDRPSTVSSMAVSEPIQQEINLDVKGTIPSDGQYITDEIGSGHDEIDVRIGRTATENEEDTQEKGKESAHLDSLQASKQQS